MNNIGIDIIEISRIRAAKTRWGDRFLNRIYTRAEIELYREKPESLAARFAAKEAAMKALNIVEPGVWREVEILTGMNGQPRVCLYGQAEKQAQKLGLAGLEVSLSHSRENAIAMVMGIKKDGKFPTE